MNKILLLFALSATLAFSVRAQTCVSYDKYLPGDKSLSAVSQAELKESIALAKNESETTRDRSGSKSEEFGTALIKWGALRTLGLTELRRDFRAFTKEREAIESLFRSAVAIFRSQPSSPIGANAKLLLANYLFQYGKSPDLDEVLTIARDALVVFDELKQGRTESICGLGLVAAVHYERADFEDFFTVYERLLPEAESAFGKSDPRLVPILILYAYALNSVDREDQSIEITRRIQKFAGQNDFRASYTNALGERAAEKLLMHIGKPITARGGASNSPVTVPDPTSVQDRSTVSRVTTPDGRTVESRMNTSGTRQYSAGTTSIDRISTVGSRILNADRVVVNVWVGEDGSVIGSKVLFDDPKVQKDVAEHVSKWKFRPLVINGSPRKMKGTFVVTYYSKINGRS